jgi:hypothetical protein
MVGSSCAQTLVVGDKHADLVPMLSAVARCSASRLRNPAGPIEAASSSTASSSGNSATPLQECPHLGRVVSFVALAGTNCLNPKERTRYVAVPLG